MAVRLLGKGKVDWSERVTVGSGSNRRTVTRKYSAEETYVNIDVIIWGSKKVSQPTKIDSGTSSFPFEFTIPPDCPPTFSTVTGKNTYQLFGIVSSQVNEYKIETPLVIRNVLDLNSHYRIFYNLSTKSLQKRSSNAVVVTMERCQLPFRCHELDFVPLTTTFKSHLNVPMEALKNCFWKQI